MFNKKCASCAKKVDKKFNFCPYCGHSFKKQKEEENFGMLGRDDIGNEFEKVTNEIKMPLGLNKIMNSLMKQLEKQMSGMEANQPGMPKGFKIQISTGKPQISPVNNQEQPKQVKEKIVITKEEFERRKKLPTETAKSQVRRIGGNIIYEISTPGIKSKKDILITKLEEGIEIRAYSLYKCYIKTIPLKVEIIGWQVKNDKVFLELKG